MKVLVACECSGIVRDAFKRLGHDAWSCDIQPTERPGQHIQDDVLKIIKRKWDMMVAHPPCTRLALSGAPHFKRFQAEQREGIDFFMKVVRAPIPRICIENPMCIMGTHWRSRTQEIHPWQFGEGELKTTWLWLKNLPNLIPTFIVPLEYREASVHNESPGKNRSKNRSRTFNGIARAMASQWGETELPPATNRHYN